jgi:lysophospholipase L1-like esterase
MWSSAATRTASLLTLAIGASTAISAWAKEPIPCKPEVWEETIAAFEAADAKEPPPKQGVLFVGSSSIRLWDLKKSFPGLPVINRGFGGSQICHATHFVDRLIAPHDPRVVVFYAGDNDIAAGKSPEQVHEDFRAFVAAVRRRLPKTPIVFIAIKPSIARWKLAEEMQAANRLIAADCEEDKTLEFVDVWPAMLGENGQPRKELLRDDRLHMTEAGYAVWTELLLPHLDPVVKKSNHDDTTDTTTEK